MSGPLVYTAHLEDVGDVLVQIYPNGDMTVAHRDAPGGRWSPPAVLSMEPPF